MPMVEMKIMIIMTYDDFGDDDNGTDRDRSYSDSNRDKDHNDSYQFLLHDDVWRHGGLLVSALDF